MTFRQFLNEYGTQGEGPGASGRRGEPLMGKDQSQKKPVGVQQHQARSKKLKGGSMSPGTEWPKDIPGSPLSPRGLGKWQAAQPSNMSPGVKFQSAQPSPFSFGSKWINPTNLKQVPKVKSNALQSLQQDK